MSQKQIFQGQHTQKKVHNHLLKNDDWLAGSIVPQGVRHIWFTVWRERHTVHRGWQGVVSAQSVLEFYLRCCMYYVSVKYPINCQGTMKTCRGNNPILRLIYLELLSCFLNKLMTCYIKHEQTLLVLLILIIRIDTNTNFFIPTQELTSTEHMTSTTLDYTNLSYIHTYWLIFFVIKFW